MGVAIDRPADAAEPRPGDAPGDAGQSDGGADARRGRPGRERRARTSSNGRSARDRRLESIGAPTVAPCVVIEPWSKRAVDETGLVERPDDDRDAGQGVDRGHRPGRRHGHGLDDEDGLDVRGRRSAGPTAAPSSAERDLDDRDRLDDVGEVRGDRARQVQPVGPEGRAGRVLPERPVRVDDADPRPAVRRGLGGHRSVLVVDLVGGQELAVGVGDRRDDPLEGRRPSGR